MILMRKIRLSALNRMELEIDFGGIAKGYTSGRIMDIFREHGITSGMVSLGGNVQVLGIKTDGSKWRVAVQNPEDTENYLGVLETQDRAVITSGGYERYFEQDGKTYQHILDPKTGYPADSGLTSVTIVSADGTLADGLSTSLFVMGKEKAVAYWRAHSEEFDAILVEKDGTVSVTENIADQFTPDDAVKKTEIITKHSSRTHVRLGRDSGQRKLTYSSQNHCTSSRSVYLSRRLILPLRKTCVITHHLQKWESSRLR